MMGESNPGPTTYQILKSIQGTFHQGNVIMFGMTAGRQCACTALLSICWSVVKQINIWKTSDLDCVLIEGDKIYKSLNTNDYLNVEELPKLVQI